MPASNQPKMSGPVAETEQSRLLASIVGYAASKWLSDALLLPHSASQNLTGEPKQMKFNDFSKTTISK
jgi:hypothetical protein